MINIKNLKTPWTIEGVDNLEKVFNVTFLLMIGTLYPLWKCYLSLAQNIEEPVFTRLVPALSAWFSLYLINKYPDDRKIRFLAMVVTSVISIIDYETIVYIQVSLEKSAVISNYMLGYFVIIGPMLISLRDLKQFNSLSAFTILLTIFIGLVLQPDHSAFFEKERLSLQFNQVVTAYCLGWYVTNRKLNAENRLLKDLEQAIISLEGTDIGVWKKDLKNGRIYATKKAWKIFDIEADTNGISLKDFRTKVIHPLDLVSFDRKAREVSNTGVFEHEFRCFNKDGDIIWVKCKARSGFDKYGELQHLDGSVIDITNDKMAFFRERDARQTLTIVTRSAKIEMFTYSFAENRIIDFSPGLFNKFQIKRPKSSGAFSELFNTTSIDALNLVVFEDDLNKMTEKRDEAARFIKEHGGSRTWDTEYRVKTERGDLIWLKESGEVYSNSEKQPARMIVAVQDITEEKHREESRVKEAESMAHTSQLKELGQAAGGIGHEINSHLGAITLNANIIGKSLKKALDANKDTDAKTVKIIISSMDGIYKAIDKCQKIIEGVKLLSRYTNVSDTFKPFNLGHTIESTLALVYDKAGAKGISLRVDFGPSHLISIRGNETHISQILVNLLNNAFDAVESQKGEKFCKLSVNRTGDLVSLSVTDSGTGIPKSEVEKIFKPFYTTKEVGKGTGLGLSLSASMAEKHGGRLYVDEKNPNTCFVLEIPVSSKKIAVA